MLASVKEFCRNMRLSAPPPEEDESTTLVDATIRTTANYKINKSLLTTSSHWRRRERRQANGKWQPTTDCDSNDVYYLFSSATTGDTTFTKRIGRRRRRRTFNLSTISINLTGIFALVGMLLSSNEHGGDCLAINVNTAQTFQAESGAGSFPSNNNASAIITRSLHKRTAGEVDALGYLQRYGYMNGTLVNANLISEDSFHDAVMNFQRFAGIPETGSVDSLTVKYMQMPRCGNKDRSGKGENGKRKKKRRRRKRYALQGSKWRRQELTYRISQYPTRFSHKKHEVDAQIEKAFKIWSQVAPIDFVVKREGKVHIDIRFSSGEHGDGDPFDGPGNTLAHAYFPQYGGDAHFDDQEYWTVNSYAGTNIFQVAAHELGHSLGLGHSSVREALMAPFYQKYKPEFKLHADDILGIQALYGERDGDNDSPTSSTSTTTTTTSTTSTTEQPESRRRPQRPTKTTPAPALPDDDDDDDNGGGFFNFGGGSSKPADLCQDATIDAITRTEDGSTYVFRGQYYWQVMNEGLAGGYPAKISRDWDGLPGNLDAALTWSDGKTFFFKGDKYWRFFNKRREPGYPKLISSGFAGVPNNVDAAFVWSGNGKTYFFKKDKYWRFDSKQEPPVSSQYPKSLKNWGGLPGGGIDSAFKWENGMTYFFKDDLYYRFDDREFEVDSSAKPAFPRSTAEWWFGCTNSNLPIRSRPAQSSDGSSNNADGSASSDQSASASTLSASSTMLMFHRRPNMVLDIGSGAQPAEQQQTSRPRAAGNSLSRSILSSLSALFPSMLSDSSSESKQQQRESSSSSSSSSSSPAASIGSSGQEDWSYHRGIGEEVRRSSVPKISSSGGRSASTYQAAAASDSPSPSRHSSSAGGSGHIAGSLLVGSRRLNVVPDNTRWLFPLSSSGAREQSLSELRMAPEESELTHDKRQIGF